MVDHYRTIGAPIDFRDTIERSVFIGFAFPIAVEEEFFAELERVQKRFFKATHHCWAYRLFAESRSRSSDAGEPSGTAGKPILTAIESADLYDVAVIVVRYFGGIKLGTGGLARAYREIAATTLECTVAIERYLYTRIRVVVPFDALSHVYRLIDVPNVMLVNEHFGEENVFSFDVRLSQENAFRKRLAELRLATLP